MQFHELRATPLVASPIHSSKSSTKTAATVEALGHFLPSRKLRIRHCPSFLNRLKHYALSEFQQPPAQPGQANPAGLNGGPSSWSRGRTVNGATLPPAGIQAEVLHELAFHYLVQTHRAPEIINCELALHLEVHAQFFAILKVWMKIRYVTSAAIAPGSRQSDWLAPDNVAVEDIRPKIPYPTWGPTIHYDNTKGMLSRHIAWESAGIPDSSLYALPTVRAAVGEIKTHWSIPWDTLQGHFQKIAAFGDGDLEWDDASTVSDKLLRQMWGELYAGQCYLGFFTNGRVVIFFAKTEENELTFSATLAWEDPDVYLTMLGLSFAAADSVLCIAHEGKNHTEYSSAVRQSMKSMVDLLCPLADRQIARPA